MMNVWINALFRKCRPRLTCQQGVVCSMKLSIIKAQLDIVERVAVGKACHQFTFNPHLCCRTFVHVITLGEHPRATTYIISPTLDHTTLYNNTEATNKSPTLIPIHIYTVTMVTRCVSDLLIECNQVWLINLTSITYISYHYLTGVPYTHGPGKSVPSVLLW